MQCFKKAILDRYQQYLCLSYSFIPRFLCTDLYAASSNGPITLQLDFLLRSIFRSFPFSMTWSLPQTQFDVTWRAFDVKTKSNGLHTRWKYEEWRRLHSPVKVIDNHSNTFSTMVEIQQKATTNILSLHSKARYQRDRLHFSGKALWEGRVLYSKPTWTKFENMIAISLNIPLIRHGALFIKGWLFRATL